MSQQPAEEISQHAIKRPRIDENVYVSKLKQNCDQNSKMESITEFG